MPLIARTCLDGRNVWGRVEGDEFLPYSGGSIELLTIDGNRLPTHDLRLLSPIEPTRLLIMLGNFLAHRGEVRPPDAVPKVMPKLVSHVAGQDAAVQVPASISGTIWSEVEIAAVLRDDLVAASPEEARNAILGFTCFNDLTAADHLPGDVFAAKSVDTFAAMGPWISTDLTEDDVRGGLRLTATVNGTTKVEGNTDCMKFFPSEVLCAVSKRLRLRAGDVLSMGTPQHCEIQRGDRIEIEVEGIGTLRNVLA